MARVRVKICGIGSLEEASLALDLGADALGLNFWKGSRRYVDPSVARGIIARLKHPFASYVGVFVNEVDSVIRDLARDLGLTAVQLHGDESVEFCESLSAIRVIKAIRVGANFDPASLSAYPVSAILLDSRVDSRYGGTGHSFDWSAAVEAKKYAPIILAGGIRADNVAEAIATVRPAAIDVCSGVEAEPGRKDLNKLRTFMAAVDRANAGRIESSSNAQAESSKQ
jgi:phosphoribosylanthranilate isomerase